MAEEQVFTQSRKYQRLRSRFQEEQRRILLFFGGVIALVVLLLLGGAVWQYALVPRRAVAKVNGEAITVADFQARVRVQRFLMVQQIVSFVAFYQQIQLSGVPIAPDPQLQAMAQLLEDTQTLGRQVLDQMIEDVLIRQDLSARGIVVSDEEVEKAIQAAFAYFPEGTPTPQPSPTPWATSTLSPTQLALLTPPPTPTPTPGGEPTATPTATPPPSPTPTATSLPEATPIPAATPTPYTFEAFQQDLKRVLQEAGISYADLRKIFRDELYRQKLIEELEKQIPTEEEQVWVRHILVPDKETADKVLLELQEGTDWFTLAQKYSQDAFTKDRGGDLGWIARGDTVPEFEEIAFLLEVGEVSGPVQTQFGWHIIQVLGKEVRPLSPQQRQQRLQEALQQWLATKRAEADIEIYENVWPKYVPTEPALPPQIRQFLAPQPTPALVPVTPQPLTPTP